MFVEIRGARQQRKYSEVRRVWLPLPSCSLDPSGPDQQLHAEEARVQDQSTLSTARSQPLRRWQCACRQSGQRCHAASRQLGAGPEQFDWHVKTLVR